MTGGDDPVYPCRFTKELFNALGDNVPMGRMLVKYAQRDGALVKTARATLPYDIRFGTESVNSTRDQAAPRSVWGEVTFLSAISAP